MDDDTPITSEMLNDPAIRAELDRKIQEIQQMGSEARKFIAEIDDPKVLEELGDHIGEEMHKIFHPPTIWERLSRLFR